MGICKLKKMCVPALAGAFFSFVCAFPLVVGAQPATPAGQAVARDNGKAEKQAVAELPDIPEGSLFFRPDEITAIQGAMNGTYIPPAIISETEMTTGVVGQTDDGAAKPYIPRRIRLSGVLYTGPGQWIVWLNGSRLTPGRLLPEVVDIEVNPQTVRLRWHDRVLQKTIAINMKPHQVYDIDTGILLPE